MPTWSDVASRVSLVLGRPVSTSQVTRWRDGREPEVEAMAALAKVLHVDPGWLAFGESSTAEAPEWFERDDKPTGAAETPRTRRAGTR